MNVFMIVQMYMTFVANEICMMYISTKNSYKTGQCDNITASSNSVSFSLFIFSLYDYI